MGLDMYLTSRHHVKNYDFMKPEERYTIITTKGNKPSPIDTNRIETIICSEAYWRKANAIHKWFVDNVQDGKDDCGNYYVSVKQLIELLTLVDRVLADHSEAPKLLPTQQGFFFGTYGYDQYYFDNLKYTQQELKRIIADANMGDLYYHSSW